MNAINLPRPVAEDETTVTLDRAAWAALVRQVEDAEDLAHVAANALKRQARGEEAFMRDCVTADEVLHVLDGETLVAVHRKRAKLTQRALAQAAGISPTYLNEVEKGKKPGSAAAFRKLASVLGVSMEALMD